MRATWAAIVSLGLIALGACAPARRPPVVPTASPPMEIAGTPVASGPTSPLEAALEAWRKTPSATHAVALAGVLRARRAFDQAVSVLSTAVSGEPENAVLHQHLALSWLEWGVPAQALPSAQRAAYFAPASADAAAVVGRVFGALDRWPEADEAFGRTVKFDPESAAGWINWAYSAYRIGDEAAALSRGAEALRRDPDSIVVRNNLALVHASAGRFDAAERELTAAMGPAEGLYNLGMLHLAREAFADAVRVFERALAVRPEFEEAHLRLRQARVRLASGGGD